MLQLRMLVKCHRYVTHTEAPDAMEPLVCGAVLRFVGLPSLDIRDEDFVPRPWSEQKSSVRVPGRIQGVNLNQWTSESARH